MQKKEVGRSGQGTNEAKAKTESKKSVTAQKSPAKKKTETSKSSR